MNQVIHSSTQHALRSVARPVAAVVLAFASVTIAASSVHARAEDIEVAAVGYRVGGGLEIVTKSAIPGSQCYWPNVFSISQSEPEQIELIREIAMSSLLSGRKIHVSYGTEKADCAWGIAQRLSYVRTDGF
jgi:hypothetical protein